MQLDAPKYDCNTKPATGVPLGANTGVGGDVGVGTEATATTTRD